MKLRVISSLPIILMMMTALNVSHQTASRRATPVPIYSGQVCANYLSSPLKYGDQNKNVIKLQTFLIGQGEEIPAGVTGYFGSQTKAAVESFQLRYSFQILYPLGLTSPTGAVYTATLAQINALWCNM